MRVVIFLSVALFASVAFAQQSTGVDVNAPGVRVQTDVNRDQNATNQYGRTNASTEKRIIRASELIGLNVTNNADETVGEINDIVIDPNDARVRYVAVSVGGFLGMGDQLFAIPWASFDCRKDGDEHKVVLNIDKETLQKAKGFNQDNWPDMANEQWQLENDRAYHRSTDLGSTLPQSVR